MYYPYLYGRQAELLALRDVAARLVALKTVPVLEPTNLATRDLATCLRVLGAQKARCCLIVNPHQGEFRSANRAAWRAQIDGFIQNPNIVRPAFQISTATDVPNLHAFLREFNGRDVAVVLRSADITPAALAGALAGQNAIAFLHARSNPGSYLSALPPAMAVEVEQCFNPQARNADYNGSEWFTSSHLTYAKQGRPGFSDFGPLPPTFSLTGGQAAAVAIHLTYEADDRSIWIQHFVSDSILLGDGDTTSKMAEATEKVFRAVQAEPAKFTVSVGLQSFLTQHRQGTPTGLATSKRQQISHHLTTVGQPI